MKKRKDIVVGHPVTGGGESPSSVQEEKRKRQRTWAKARQWDINNHLFNLGHTFDEQPKGN